MKIRDSTFDFLKGVAIVLMVVGHAGAFGWRGLADWIYLFHMPIFFMLAGWFYRGISSEREFVGYVWAKLMRLWLPFVMVAGIFILLHDLFLWMNVYSVAGARRFGAEFMTVWGLKKTAIHYLKTVLMQDGFSGMAGACWFLKTLLQALVMFALTDLILAKMFQTERLRGLACALIAIDVILVSKYTPRHLQAMVGWFGGGRMLTAYFLIWLGTALRVHAARAFKVQRENAWIVGGAFLLLIILSFGERTELAMNEFSGVCFLVVAALSGWFFLQALARLLPQNLVLMPECFCRRWQMLGMEG